MKKRRKERKKMVFLFACLTAANAEKWFITGEISARQSEPEAISEESRGSKRLIVFPLMIRHFHSGIRDLARR